MKRTILSSLVAGPALLLAALVAPGMVSAAGPISSTACDTTTTPGVATCDLWAEQGQTTLPDTQVVPVWGFTSSAVGAVTAPGGPVLIVNQDDDVTINLTNDLDEPTALVFEGLSVAPDLTPVAATGGTHAYQFTASTPGTYLYEAAPLSGGQHQTAMGLYGMLIVRSSTAGQAYDLPTSAFVDEAAIVVSELDPALNQSADPSTYDLRAFAPRYFLINGRAYPDTLSVDAVAGQSLLVRYANAGIRHHSMATLGIGQQLIAEDGSEYAHPRGVVAESVGPGQTFDAIVSVPGTTPDGTRFALYDANQWFANANGTAFGGMLTFIEASSGPPGGGGGPVTSDVALSPNPTNGSVDVTLSATVEASATGAEYFVDALGADGTGCPVIVPPTSIEVQIPVSGGSGSCPDLTSLSSGNHTIYVHAQDGASWGAPDFAVLNLDKAGPAISAIVLSPAAANGTADVSLSATASDVATGGSNVDLAEYTLNGVTSPMTVNVIAPIASITATIDAATVNALSEGPHSVDIHARDVFGNWGDLASITLTVDKTGPSTSNVAAAPNPSNGQIGFNSTTPAVHVTASFADGVAVAAAEGFIDTIGPNGSGFVFTATDGVFNSAAETGYADIPLTTILTLSNGDHTIYVHGRDSAGNWGATSTVVLTVDKNAPTVSNVQALPSPTNGQGGSNTIINLTATASDQTGVTQAEWFEGSDPGAGNGTPMTINPAGPGQWDLSASIDFVTLGWSMGTHTISVRAGGDLAGNGWGPVASTSVIVVKPNLFFDGFDSGNTSAWSTTGGNPARLSVTAGGQGGTAYKLNAQIASGSSGYVQDNSPAAETSYHARFYLNPNGYSTGNGGNPTPVTILRGLTASNGDVFQVQYRRSSNNNNAGYSVRLVVNRAGGNGTTSTSWYSINNNNWNAIEIGWASGASASASLYTGGTLRETLTGMDTSAYSLETVRLGPTGSGLPNSGTVYLDSFFSSRTVVIGP